ncbi:MAG: hypothetical protein LBD42_04705, partial [Desulfovibrio sp.]|nr:hypothetical protein [Desulfovibrio sp.]
MALTVPHNSQVGISVAGVGKAANYVSASYFMTPGQSAMPEALRHLAAGIDNVGGAANQLLLERRRMQNATDMLADKIEYENALREFDSDYRQTKQGVDARTAAEDYDAFHGERLEILRQKWGGNPFLMENVSRMAEGIRSPSMNNAFAFRDQQEQAHMEAVGKAEWQQTLSKLADPSITFAERQAVLRDSEASLRMLSGQRWEEDGEGGGRWVGGRNVDAELDRRRQVFHSEHVETLVALGRTVEAAKYVRGHTGDFGERSNDLLAKIRAVGESNAARGREAAKRAEKEQLDGVYTQWRDEAKKAGLTLEEQQAFITGRISDDLKTPDERDYAMRLAKMDFVVEKTRRDAGDMAAIMKAADATKDMLPSEKAGWLDANWSGSREGRVAAEKAIAEQPRRSTPENIALYNKLRVMIDTKEVVDTTQISAFAYRNGLTVQQGKDAEAYLQSGGKDGAVKVKSVQDEWMRLNPGKKKEQMPVDLPDIVRGYWEPGKFVNQNEMTRVIAALLMAGETRTGDSAFAGFGVDETREEAIRNNRLGGWLSDDDVSAFKELEKSGEAESVKKEIVEYFDTAVGGKSGINVTPRMMLDWKKRYPNGVRQAV